MRPAATDPGGGRRADVRRVVSATQLVCAVWCLLLATAQLQRLWSPFGGALVPFLAACGLVLACRGSRGRGAGPGRRHAGPRAFALSLGLAAGWLGYPALVSGIGAIGLALGLPPAPVARPLGASEAIAIVVLAPVFEELLYRERLLCALAPVAGWPLAIALSSALFAASHLEAWSVLGTFVAGLLLGTLLRITGDVWLCVATHAGLNAAAALPSAGARPSGCAAALLLAAACALARAAAQRSAEADASGGGSAATSGSSAQKRQT